MNIFRRQTPPVSVREVFRESPTEPTAWSRLEALGYTMERGVTKDGKTEYAFYCNGKIESEWSKPLTIHESLNMREAWAAARLEALKE
jgi:hypothetical protein